MNELLMPDGSGRSTGWLGLATIALLQVATELIPLVFGAGDNAIWDWSFLFVTLRFVVVPLLALVYIAAIIAAAVKHDSLRPMAALRVLGAALLAAFSWIYDGVLFVSG